MDIEPFRISAHLEHVEGWLRARKMASSLAHDLPKVGFIVYENSIPICAGFLRHVETHYAMLDGLITNPDAAPELRNAAIDAVVGKIIMTARRIGVEKIIANSTDEHTLLRSKKFGFEVSPHTVIVLDL